MKKSLINDVRYIEVQINLFFTLPYIYCIFEEIKTEFIQGHKQLFD